MTQGKSTGDARFALIGETPPPADGKAQKGAAAPAKFWIQSLDEPGISVNAQFNPKELQIDREVPWSPPGEAGKKEGKDKKPTDLEFTGAKGRTMSVELLFDAYEAKGPANMSLEPSDLTDRVSKLEQMASVRETAQTKEDQRRPHKCVAAWGPALNRFECVITGISTKYEMFDRAGAPLRARVTLKLLEAGAVSTKKPEGTGAAKPAAAPAAPKK